MFRSAFYEAEITPPLGSVIPGDFAERRSARILDPLYARAFAAEADGVAAGIVSLDCTGVPEDIACRIRDRACALAPFSPEGVMVCATHCHGGGPTLDWGEEVRRDGVYLDFLVQRAADALVTAFHRLEPCTLRGGSSELTGYAFVRDFRMRDGSLRTNPGVGNPDIDRPLAEPDPEVRVIAAFDASGQPRGAVVNFACHPAIVASDVTSADYIGALSARMKELYGAGFVTVFLNGACGNINHVNPADPESTRDGIHLALGRALAEQAARALDAAGPLEPALRCAFSRVTLRRRKPDAGALLWARSVYDALGEHPERSVPGTPGYVETFFAWQAFGLAQDRRPDCSLPVQTLVLGGTAIFGCPCQIYVQYGRALKAAAPGAMVCAFTNAYGGYVPTPDCIGGTIYEGRLASTSQLEPEAGEKLVSALTALL